MSDIRPAIEEALSGLDPVAGDQCWRCGQKLNCLTAAGGDVGQAFEGCSSFQIAALQATGKVHRYSCVYADPPVAFSAQTSVERVAQDAKKHALKLHAPDKYHVYDD